MNPFSLLLLSGVVLLSPWALITGKRSRPEIHGVRKFLWIVNRLYCLVWHRLEAPVMAPVPAQGAAILISNHTAGLDPMVLQASSQRVLGFLIAREFYEFWALRPMCRLLGCIPVRRDGHDLAATRAALRALDEGRVVPIFPEGRINPTSGMTLLEAKPGVAFLVLHAKVPVIPAFIWGTPATNQVWRGLITPSHTRVIYGEPIDLTGPIPDGPIDKQRLAIVAEQMMDAIRALQRRALGSLHEGVRQSDGPEDDLRVGPTPEGRPYALSGDRASQR